ncbi:MAG: amidohydrolase family protein [Verrucomicrobia bacterium]|nr:amidohydrolase family protein [Verrucomicrobiota bacterium]
MILDGHIHIYSGLTDITGFAARLTEAGVDGGLVMSVAPPVFAIWADPTPAMERVDEVLEVARAAPEARLFPFFWIDPMEANAVEQVDEAVKRGISGFKVICSTHYPGDPKAMAVYRRIAGHGKPILFHSGILSDTTASSRYNRPAEFECLLGVDRLRFALAHLAWPWCDELIAVYYKASEARHDSPDVTAEMFVDTTPGTPPIYRQDAFTKLYACGPGAADYTFFGTDRGVNDYDVRGVRELIERDTAMCDALGFDTATRDKFFAGNLLRFVGSKA